MSTLSFKQPLWIGMSIILFFALVLSACGSASSPAASRGTSTPAGNQELASQSITPTSAENPADTQLEYTSQDFGFSLYYPKEYEVQRTFVQMINFLAPQDTPGERLRGWLEVERGLDQDAAWYADQAKQDNASLGSQVTSQISSSTSVIDGQQAYILERMPGQDLSRQVFIVYEGFLYHLTFWPDDPQAGAAYQQMETLYAAVINSLHFLPERELVPPVTSINNMVYQLERALEARSEDDIMRLLDEEFSLANWMPNAPESVTFARYGRYAAAQLILDQYLSQAPDLTLEKQVDWTSLLGDPFPFFRFFPDEVITPVLVIGWGHQGADEAVMIIAHRSDGSLYWRDLFVAQGTFAP
jgi:hypothetical protein